MSIGIGIGHSLRQRISVKIAISIDPNLNLYETYWERMPKHKWTIPKGLLAGGYEEIKAVLPIYENGRAEFLADILGGVTLFSNAGEIRGFLAETHDKLPLEMRDDGLHYTVALTTTYGLANRVPKERFKEVIDYEMLTRASIPGERLDGNVGVVVAPATLITGYNVKRRICPFIFTDFEVEDKDMKRDFRRVTAARQIGRLLGGQDGEEELEGLVGEHLGVADDYREWTREVAQKTPFRDLNKLQERYKGVDLKDYL